MSIVADKLRIDGKEFVTSAELRDYCSALHLDYGPTSHYLFKMKYLTRIFKGIFYVKTLEESKLGIIKRYNHLELVAKGLELKGVKNWYFGLHAALHLNNMTHEYFTVDEVVSDTVFRAKPVSIAGNGFRFVKLSPALFDFGIIREGEYRYSDSEKTILDFAYLLTYRGVSAEMIVENLSDWAKNTSRDRMMEYSKNYPKTVAKTASEIAAE